MRVFRQTKHPTLNEDVLDKTIHQEKHAGKYQVWEVMSSQEGNISNFV